MPRFCTCLLPLSFPTKTLRAVIVSLAYPAHITHLDLNTLKNMRKRVKNFEFPHHVIFSAPVTLSFLGPVNKCEHFNPACTDVHLLLLIWSFIR